MVWEGEGVKSVVESLGALGGWLERQMMPVAGFRVCGLRGWRCEGGWLARKMGDVGLFEFASRRADQGVFLDRSEQGRLSQANGR